MPSRPPSGSGLPPLTPWERAGFWIIIAFLIAAAVRAVAAR